MLKPSKEDKCADCGQTRDHHKYTQTKCRGFRPLMVKVTCVRYEVECAPGAIVAAPGIMAFVATRGRTAKAVVVVLVDPDLREDFEKAVEGDKHVVGYSADPNGGDGREEKTYARK